ncbi:unnamed protein product [Gongylonema pulchrum]|uniref:MARVEL domain-containing protein n=1 Tax=Gongylonema pulchrum TaxID=637853 RepID=A0A183EHF3_9BILA|nr:unnamed protein product [Gongylonema pulchrum]
MGLNTAFLKRPFGIFNSLAVLIALFSIFACSLRWNSKGDVYIQLVYASYVLQTVILVSLIIIMTIATIVLLLQLMSCARTLSLPRKSGVLGAFAICLVLSLVVFAIEVWYAVEYDIENRIARSRVIIVMVMAVILSIIFTVLIVVVGIYHRNRSAQVTTIAVQENRTGFLFIPFKDLIFFEAIDHSQLMLRRLTFLRE